MDGGDTCHLSYSHIVTLYIGGGGGSSGDVIEGLVSAALTGSSMVGTAAVQAVDRTIDAITTAARPTGLGIAGYKCQAEFTSAGLVCTFPSCVFHESRIPSEGHYTAVKMVIFERA